MDVMSMSFTELQNFWEEYKAEQASWGGLLLHPYPKLLTTWYAERVIEESIPASKEVILAAKRHLLDLERQGTDDFPWIFDEERGHRPIRFIEDNCKPTEGDIDNFVMQPWQHFAIGSIFGWVHKDTDVRRFREALIFLGRKNGKTTMISGLSGYELGFDGEHGANVYVLANSKDQSLLLYDKTKEMIKVSPLLDKKYKAQRSVIRDESSFSKMEARASDSKKLDGLNTHFAIFDEIHEFTDYKLINVIKKSRGTRKQPLVVYITTAGYVLDGPLMQYVESGMDCLENPEDDIDERTFYFIAKLDEASEADDPMNWIKANPNIYLMDFVSLVSDWKKQRMIPQEKADWITKQFNLFSDIDEMSFLDMDTINLNKKTIDLSELEGKECVGGYDLAETEDFTSACIEFPIYETGEIVLLEHNWICQSRYNRDNNQPRLDEWIKNGDLTVVPGNYVNYQPVFDWFVEQSKKYKILKIGYDRKNSLNLNQLLINHGFELEEIRQGFMTLGGPMKDIKERFLDGKVIFNNQKIFRWYLSNVKLVQDRNLNWMPTKQSKFRKIDGFAALLDSHAIVVDMLANSTKKIGKVGFISVRSLRGR